MTRKALARAAFVAGFAFALALGAAAPATASAAACKIIICGQKAQAAPDDASQLAATISAAREITTTHEVTDPAWLAQVGDVIGGYLSARADLLRAGSDAVAMEELVVDTQRALDALLNPLISPAPSP